MQIAIVIGSVWSTRKEESLVGRKLLIVRPLDILDENADIQPIVAVDTIGAGVGEMVLLVSGSSARVAARDEQTPTDAAIVGIIDDKEVDKRYARAGV